MWAQSDRTLIGNLYASRTPQESLRTMPNTPELRKQLLLLSVDIHSTLTFPPSSLPEPVPLLE